MAITELVPVSKIQYDKQWIGAPNSQKRIGMQLDGQNIVGTINRECPSIPRKIAFTSDGTVGLFGVGCVLCPLQEACNDASQLMPHLQQNLLPSSAEQPAGDLQISKQYSIEDLPQEVIARYEGRLCTMDIPRKYGRQSPASILRNCGTHPTSVIEWNEESDNPQAALYGPKCFECKEGRNCPSFIALTPFLLDLLAREKSYREVTNVNLGIDTDSIFGVFSKRLPAIITATTINGVKYPIRVAGRGSTENIKKNCPLFDFVVQEQIQNGTGFKGQNLLVGADEEIVAQNSKWCLNGCNSQGNCNNYKILVDLLTNGVNRSRMNQLRQITTIS